MIDLIIVGGGPAGITAAIYAARKKMNFLLITKDTGGQASWSFDTDNYPGFRHISGLKLMEKFEEHLKDYNIQMKLDEDAAEIKKISNGFEIVTNKNSYQTKTVLICSGKIPKRLNVSGEEKFLGSGVAYCAVCDAPFFKDKVVAVVGGGNSAVDAVFHLENIAKKIYLINIEPKPCCDEILHEKVEKIDKVEILNDAKINEIMGVDSVTGIKIEQYGNQKIIDVDGAFIEIGFIPNTSFASGLVKLNECGEIVIDNKNMTSVPGIFAAGDVTDVSGKQLVIAAGEGAKALLSVANYLKRVEE
jgi:alkyl hydroperoxide reductase subunit F